LGGKTTQYDLQKRLIRKKPMVYNCARHYSGENNWLEYKSLKKKIDHKLKYQQFT